jgi:hypothetical protein
MTGSPRTLSDALAELRRACARQKSPLGVRYGRSNRGALAEALGRLGFPGLADELQDWYGWRTDEGLLFLPNNMVVQSFEDSVRDCELMRTIRLDVVSEGAIDPFWLDTYFPVTGQDGDWLIIDWVPAASETARYYFRDDGANGTLTVDSLATLLDFWTTAIDEDAIIWNSESSIWLDQRGELVPSSFGFRHPHRADICERETY